MESLGSYTVLLLPDALDPRQACVGWGYMGWQGLSLEAENEMGTNCYK